MTLTGEAGSGHGIEVSVGEVAGALGDPITVLPVVVAVHLGRRGLDAERRSLVVAVGLVGALWNVGAAFLLGVAAEAALRRVASDG